MFSSSHQVLYHLYVDQPRSKEKSKPRVVSVGRSIVTLSLNLQLYKQRKQLWREDIRPCEGTLIWNL